MPDPTTASCHVSTCGDFLHRFRPLIGAVSDEHRFHLNEDGIFITTVDPANVMMIETSVDGDQLSDYAVEIQRTVGLDLSRLKSVINYARKGRGKQSEGDYVAIDVTDTGNLAVTVMRDETNRKRVIPTLNTDTIRLEPDMPSLQESYDWRCHVPVSEFADAISAIDEDHRHVQFAICDVSGGVYDKLTGDLALYSHTGVDDSKQDLEDEFRFDNAAEAPADASDPPVSLFSLDYLVDIADAVKTATDDAKLLIEFGDEHPLFATIEVPEYGLDATYCLAPRKNESGDRIKHPSWGTYP